MKTRGTSARRTPHAAFLVGPRCARPRLPNLLPAEALCSSRLCGPHCGNFSPQRHDERRERLSEFQRAKPDSAGTMQLADRRRLGGSRRAKSARAIRTSTFDSPFSEPISLRKMRASAPFGRCEPPRRRRSYCMVTAEARRAFSVAQKFH